MSEIILRDICKSYENGFQAVKNFNLEIEKGELVVFVGPSGCGKSTTLRMIAGLEDISDGELWIGDKLVNYLEPKERDLAMVFQSYALYPQMNIYDNIAFSLQVRKVPKKEIDKRVHHVAELLGLENLLKQRPKNLSAHTEESPRQIPMGTPRIRNMKKEINKIALIIYLASFLSVVIVFMLLFVLLSVFLALSVLQQKSRQNSMK